MDACVVAVFKIGAFYGVRHSKTAVKLCFSGLTLGMGLCTRSVTPGMKDVVSSAVADPVLGLLVVLSFVIIIFLARDGVKGLLLQRRQRRARERQRQQFWGYE